MSGLKNAQNELPIIPFLPKIIETLLHQKKLILQAEPGAGKTTQVPAALLQAVRGEVWVLEPRRLAAKLTAQWIAESRGEQLGDLVGFQVKQEARVGPRTRLRFVTEGLLLQKCLEDPTLRNIEVVVLDEFHERHLHSEVALAHLRWLVTSGIRADLKILVMSATLDTEKLSDYLGLAPVICVPGRTYPVEIEYLAERKEEDLALQVLRAVKQCLQRQTVGDILVFLPGMREIRRCETSLLSLKQIEVVVLHGDLSADEQKRAWESLPTQARLRKVILSTNIAETSITLPQVTAVIDSGLVRQADYRGGDPGQGHWATLRTKSISRASGTQRSGRAGRVGPGYALRLFSKAQEAGRAAFETPEILRADLARTLLEIMVLRERLTTQGGKADLGFDLESLETEFLDPPHLSRWQQAQQILGLLGAIEFKELNSKKVAKITQKARDLLRFPVHPRLADWLLRVPTAQTAAVVAGLASGKLQSQQGASPGSLEAWLRRETFSADGLLKTPSLRRDQERLLSLLKVSKVKGQVRGSFFEEAFRSFPESVARRVSNQNEKRVAFQLASGTRFELMGSEASAVVEEQAFQWALFLSDSTYFEGHGDPWPECLLDDPFALLKEDQTFYFDERFSEVRNQKTLKYGSIVLEESVSRAKLEIKSIEILLEQIFKKLPNEWESAVWVEAQERFRKFSGAHLDLLKVSQACFEWCSTHGVESISLKAIEEGLESQRYSFEQEGFYLSKNSVWLWIAGLEIWAFSPENRAQLRAKFPQWIKLPGGKKTTIHYEFNQPAWIESRLQDFFGMHCLPNLSFPLVARLLAPNYRPVQITSDLTSFWKNAYPTLRKELMRRYPKHAWPENPLG